VRIIQIPLTLSNHFATLRLASPRCSATKVRIIQILNTASNLIFLPICLVALFCNEGAHYTEAKPMVNAFSAHLSQ
jgi:hypothetical protein